MSRIRVLIVDDHLVFAQALQTALDLYPDMEVVGLVGNGLEAPREAVRTSPDVIIMDYGLPGVNGAVATQAIKELMPTVRVIMLTSFAETQVLLESLKAGVSSFLTKEKAVADVVEAVRLAADGDMQMPPATLRSLLARLQEEVGGAEQVSPHLDDLSPRELEVLERLAGGANHDAIAKQLRISPHTVRTHTQHILEKLGVHSKLEAVALAIRERLIQPPL